MIVIVVDRMFLTVHYLVSSKRSKRVVDIGE